MSKRTKKDIWEGLYDFYLIEKTRSTRLETLFEEDSFLFNLKPANEFEVVRNIKHLLSHQTIIATFIYLKTSKKPAFVPETNQFYSLRKVDSLPKPILIERFLQQSVFFS